MRSDDHPAELLVVYALGAIEADERSEIEEHLLDCAECREELAQLQADVALLAVDNAVEPPAYLRARVLDAAFTSRAVPDGSEGDVEPIRPRENVVVTPKASQWGRPRRWASAAMPALAAACVLLAIVAGVQMNRISDLNSELDKQEQRPTVDPDTSTSVMVGDDVAKVETSGQLAKTVARVGMDKGASNMLVLESMPEPPIGKAWQVWMIDADGNKLSMNVMEHGAPMAVLQLPKDTKISAIAITLEKSGGAEQPTTAPLAFGDMTV